MDNRDEMIRIIEQGIPFNVHLGIKVADLGHGFARLELPYKPEFVGDPRRPALHGGVISTMVDTCGGTAVWASCTPEAKVATIDLRVDYLRPAPEDTLVAEAEVKLLGNRVGNAQIVIYAKSDPDKHIAEGRGVYNIRNGIKGR